MAPGHKIGTPEPLVRELKSEEAAALKKKYEGKAKTPPKEQARLIQILYRVGHLLADLGWVDLDLECSTILPGQ